MHISRRNAFKAGITALTAGSALSYETFAAPKAPGETRVLYFGGDYVHNGVMQERYIRETFSATDWTFLFAQASHFITPDVIASADLFMLTRVGDYDAQGFSPDGLVADRPEPDDFLNPEMERAIIDNVEKRGMGFMPLHCTMGNLDNVDLMRLIGIKPEKSGAPTQRVRMYNFNQDHPITAGFDEFIIENDENLVKEIVDDTVVRLFRCEGLEDNSFADGGWCVERGNGRIVALMGGHLNATWHDYRYRQLHWRAAHWAMKREIPEFRVEE